MQDRPNRLTYKDAGVDIDAGNVFDSQCGDLQQNCDNFDFSKLSAAAGLALVAVAAGTVATTWQARIAEIERIASRAAEQEAVVAALAEGLKRLSGGDLAARIEAARGPIGPLNRFQMEEMIDPRDTRRLVCEWVETAYRIVNQPSRIVQRGLKFRP